ncbi:MAG: hypothetical protein RMK45_10035 [Armatimonadota bacterium]|nr:hypothetical protein [Armatimonadota bacterium]
MRATARLQETTHAQQWGAFLPVLSIGACVTLLWSLHLKDSITPNVDFYGFYRIAEAIRDTETPLSFKRAPLYTAMLVPVAEPETPTPAAILLGRILSLVGYLLLSAALYALMRRLTPRLAFPATLLFMLNPHYILFVALQPLADSWLSFGAVLGSLSMLTGAWGLGVLGLLLSFNARYDGIAILPALLVRFREQWKRPVFWLSVAACLAPVALWLLWGWSATGHLSPYVQETKEAGHSAWRFLAVMVYTWFASFLPQGVMLEETMFRMPNLALLGMFGVGSAGAILWGLWSLYQAGYRQFLASALAFAIIYTALHMWFAAALPRYTLPVNWLFYLGFAAFLERAFREGFNRLSVALLGLMTVPMLVALGLSDLKPLDWLAPIGFALLLGWAFWQALPRWAVALLPLGLTLALYNSAAGRAYWVDAHLTRNAELVAFAEWYRKQPNPPRVAVFRWAWRHLVEVEQLPASHILQMTPDAYADPKKARQWLQANHISHVLWNESEYYFERAAKLNPTYVAMIRSFYTQAGISGSFIHKVHSKQINGWRFVRKYELGGRAAVLYEHASNDS